ncbi:MAG: hypothetical protein AAFN79_09515 [Pseudomonadota bacterium]
METVEATPDRLVLRSGFPFFGVFLALGGGFGLWRAAMHPGDFETDVERYVVGAIFLGLIALAWWAFPRTTLVMDRSEGVAVISEQRIGRRATRAFRIADIDGVRVLNVGRKGRSLVPHLMVGGAKHPITRASLRGERAYEVQRTIEEWLTAA